MPIARRLVLVRHATAQPTGPDGDASRELSPLGWKEAEALGEWLKQQGLLGDAVLCSPALRTRQTWACIDESTGHGVLITMEPGIYEAQPEVLLDILQCIEDEVRTLVLVGHAPGVPQLAWDLCQAQGDTEGLAALSSGFSGFAPASCAVVEFDGDWADLGEGMGRLTAMRPGNLT